MRIREQKRDQLTDAQQGGGRRARERAELELDEAKTRVRESRRRLKRRLRELEREWWEERIRECEEACAQGNIGEMYKILYKLGTRGQKATGEHTLTTEDFKKQFEKVSKDRYEEPPWETGAAVDRARDFRGDRRAIEEEERLNRLISEAEVRKAIKEIRESSPGEEGVRIGYIRHACEEMQGLIIELVQLMFDERADKWSDALKTGVIVPLFKKGNRNDPNNYRGVCLLALGSRILARILAKRIGEWAETLKLLDENQAGFRRGRSTADVVQIMVRIEEDVQDLKRRNDEYNLNINNKTYPEARLLDLTKAYPRVNKPALWRLLERYGMKGKCLETMKDLHEATSYKVRRKEGTSEEWMPARGLREGFST